jgi:hypothetical protein
MIIKIEDSSTKKHYWLTQYISADYAIFRRSWNWRMYWCSMYSWGWHSLPKYIESVNIVFCEIFYLVNPRFLWEGIYFALLVHRQEYRKWSCVTLLRYFNMFHLAPSPSSLHFIIYMSCTQYIDIYFCNKFKIKLNEKENIFNIPTMWKYKNNLLS